MPKLNNINKRLAFQLATLVVVTIVCFLPAIDSFFVADDIWQVNFAHKVFDGRTELIWRNFTSNYLQLPSFDFYRPLLGFTFLFDYFCFGVQSVGYHITSIVLYLITVLFVFALTRQLTSRWPDSNSSWTAFFTALLFSVNPLHCEDVSWISGRADILCAPFYLLSFYLVLRSDKGKNKRLLALSILSYCAALLSKEIAIGLPIVIAAYYFIWREDENFSEPFEMKRLTNWWGKKITPEAAKKDEKPNAEPESMPGKSDTRAAKAIVSARQAAHYERTVKKGKKKRKKKEAGVSSEEEALGLTAAEAVEPDSDDTAGSEDISVPVKRSNSTFFDSLKLALKMSWPFAAASAVYLAIRWQALGTIIGGYSGMMGGALGRHLIWRWFDPVNVERIMLPIPMSVSTSLKIPQWILGICLATCVLIILLRLLAQANPSRWFFFLSVWMITTIVPLAKLWGVGMDLETGRLLFFFTIAYSALWPVLVFHPTSALNRLPAEANRNLGIISAAVFMIMTGTMGWATFKTNTFWLVAGHELKAIWLETLSEAEKLGSNEKIIVLGIPKDYKGAHLNFNGSTFHHLLRPPFTKTPVSSKVLTFEPYIIGPYEVINSDRLKALKQFPENKGPIIWDRDKWKYKPIEIGGQRMREESIDLPVRASAGVLGSSAWRFDGKGTSEVVGNRLVVHNTADGGILKIDKLNISPIDFDFIEFDFKAALKKGDYRSLAPLAVGWNSDFVGKDRADNWSVIALNVEKVKTKQRVRMQLSHFWQWFSAGTIKSLVIRLFDADTVEVSDIRLIKRDHYIPFAGLKNLVPLNSGEYVVNKEPIVFLFDGSHVPHAKTVEIQITSPNFFFDNYLMGTRDNAVNHTLSVNVASGGTELRPELFPQPAYYEIRVRCLDEAQKPVGVWSEPVTILKMGGGLDTYVY